MDRNHLTVALIGDSILAQMHKNRLHLLERSLADGRVHNLAVGGWNAADVVEHAEPLQALALDAVVLSVGLNDAAGVEAVGAEVFRAGVQRVLDATPCPVVILLPPSVNEAAATGLNPRTNSTLAKYRALLPRLTHRPGLGLLDPDSIPAVYPGVGREPDGVHLTEAAYAALIPLIARGVLRHIRSRGEDG